MSVSIRSGGARSGGRNSRSQEFLWQEEDRGSKRERHRGEVDLGELEHRVEARAEVDPHEAGTGGVSGRGRGRGAPWLAAFAKLPFTTNQLLKPAPRVAI